MGPENNAGAAQAGNAMRHHDTCARHCRRPFFAAGLLLLAALAMADWASAAEGWRDETGEVIHYSGLRCPDRIATLTRIDASGHAERALANCTYQAPNLHAVIQIMEANVIAAVADELRQHYTAAGFTPVIGDGITKRGLTFIVGHVGEAELRETLWPIRIGQHDFMLWMNYPHPGAHAEVAMAYNAFVEMLRATEPAKNSRQ